MDLHSTMYLFKHFLRKHKNICSIDLHSTMYLFKHRHVCHLRIKESNLHSTMYLFKPRCIFLLFVFYYHLHSTMYLFKHLPYSHLDFIILIYIPLCIYLNKGICVESVHDFAIYIPLCIYLNSHLSQKRQPSPASFTFHYVSI